MSTEKLINGVEIFIEALKEAVETRQIEKQASIEEAERLYKQVITFREAAKRKELEIDALNETIEYLQNRSGRPQFVNERLNRMADTNPQAHRSACTTNQFSGEVGDVQQGSHDAAYGSDIRIGEVDGRVQGDLGYDNGCGCDPQG